MNSRLSAEPHTMQIHRSTLPPSERLPNALPESTRRRRFVRGSAAPLAGFVGVFLALSACGGSQSGRGGSGGKCEVPTGQRPSFAPLGEPSYPESSLWVHARVPTGSLEARIAAEVPKNLASADGQDVGAPGKATYRVTRGQPKIALEGGKVKVQVPINADISVCKPIGQMCIGYGKCRPSFVAEFSLTPSLGPEYELAPPKGTIRSTKKCVIGVDVTPQIERIARDEVKKVERQIAAEWPKLLPEVKRGFAELAHPVPLAPEQCFFVAPETIQYGAPSFVPAAGGTNMHLSVGATGKILPAESCSEEREAPAVLTPTAVPSPTAGEPTEGTTTLFLPEILPWDKVNAALKKSLEGPWAGEGSSLTVSETAFSATQVALHLELEGPVCGSTWVMATLAHEPGQAWLTLTVPSLVAKPTGKKSEAERLASLYSHIQEKARIELSPNALLVPGAERGLMTAIGFGLPKGTEISIAPPAPGTAEIQGSTAGLVVSMPIKTELLVTNL